MQPLALVADDDSAFRAAMLAALVCQGFRVLGLEDGEALRRAALDEPPAVIVTDEHMPGCSGSEAIRAVRDAGLAVPALVVSAFPDAALRARVAMLDPCVLLPKPVDLQALIGALARVMQSA